MERLSSTSNSFVAILSLSRAVAPSTPGSNSSQSYPHQHPKKTDRERKRIISADDTPVLGARHSAHNVGLRPITWAYCNTRLSQRQSCGAGIRAGHLGSCNLTRYTNTP